MTTPQELRDQQDGRKGIGGCMLMVAGLIAWIAMVGIFGWWGLLAGAVALAALSAAAFYGVIG